MDRRFGVRMVGGVVLFFLAFSDSGFIFLLSERLSGRLLSFDLWALVQLSAIWPSFLQ
jgi:hypothetical protein